MAAATETTNATERLPPGMVLVRLTTTGTTSTYVCPYFGTIVAAVGNNETDNDGVGVAVSGTTITITVDTLGDVVTLMVAGLA